MKKVIYLGYYDESDARVVSPAACTMMEYVIRKIDSAFPESVVISPAQSRELKGTKREEKKKFRNTKIIYLPSLNRKGVLRVFNRFHRQQLLYQELMKQIRDGDTLLVYHSLSYMNVVKKVKKVRNFNLVLQVCELYSDVSGNEKMKKKELDYFGIADRYLFPTEQLNALVNPYGKPHLLLPGTYSVEGELPKVFYKRNDREIHCLYAGTLDPRKGGAMAAVAAAKMLPAGYFMHILGFGNATEVYALKQQISETQKQTQCQISFDGCLFGDDYFAFLQSCDIGLSTQTPDAAFNETSFPSKILSYIANGLRVVSVKIEPIVCSSVGDLIYYYDEQTPEKIASAILSVDFSQEYNGRERIRKLDSEFAENIRGLL